MTRINAVTQVGYNANKIVLSGFESCLEVSVKIRVRSLCYVRKILLFEIFVGCFLVLQPFFRVLLQIFIKLGFFFDGGLLLQFLNSFSSFGQLSLKLRGTEFE